MIKVVVIVPTAGRPGVLVDLVRQIGESVTNVDGVQFDVAGIVVAPTLEDLGSVQLPSGWTAITGSRGLTRQRNLALDNMGFSPDFVFYFDDDAIPREDYLSNALRVFLRSQSIVGITGNVIIDGAKEGVEYSSAEALSALAESVRINPFDDSSMVELPFPAMYGCNFGVRWSSVRDLRFDEHLPLYSWLEDLDFSRRCQKKGDLAKVNGCVVAHRGSRTGGRVAHTRLGYSQVANPLHLYRKGSIDFSTLTWLMRRPILKNLILSLRTDGEGAWRRARLRGNARAIAHFVLHGGVVAPEYILQIQM